MRDLLDIMEGVRGGTFRVFHGTQQTFRAFDDRQRGTAHGRAPINLTGFNFTDSEEVAKTFGSNVLTCDVTILKPKVIDAKGATYSQFKHKLNDILDTIRGQDFDGVIIRDYMDAGVYGDEYLLSNHYVPFYKDQIKIIRTPQRRAKTMKEGVENIPEKFQAMIKDDHIEVWRAIKANRGFLNDLYANSGLGKCWSYLERGAVSYDGGRGGQCFRIHGLMPVSSIDWPKTIAVENRGEHEIRAIAGKPFTLLDVAWVDETGWVHEEDVKPEIRGMTMSTGPWV